MDMNGAAAAHQALGLLVFNPFCSPWVHMSRTTSPILQMRPLRLRGDLSQVAILGAGIFAVWLERSPSHRRGAETRRVTAWPGHPGRVIQGYAHPPMRLTLRLALNGLLSS